MGFFPALPGPQSCWIGWSVRAMAGHQGAWRSGGRLPIPLAPSPCSFRTGSNCSCLLCPDWRYEKNKKPSFSGQLTAQEKKKVILTHIGRAQTVSSIWGDLWMDRERNAVRDYPIKHNTLVLRCGNGRPERNSVKNNSFSIWNSSTQCRVNVSELRGSIKDEVLKEKYPPGACKQFKLK